MQVKVQRLREALQLLGLAVPKKSALPVLANVLLKDGQAVATDLEVAVALEFPEAEGQCLLPYRSVVDLLKRVPWHNELTIEQKGKTLNLAWSGGKASYEAHEPDDYPPLPKVKPLIQQTLPGDDLVRVLSLVAPFCATDQTRPVLAGVHLLLGEQLTVAAGDGFRMVYQVLPVAVLAAEGLNAALIPAGAVHVLAYLWRKTPRTAPTGGSLVQVLTAKSPLELALSQDMLQARFGPVTLLAKLIQGTPPNWRQLIPGESALKVWVYAPDLERAVRQVAGVARDGSGIVRLTWDEGELTVSAKSEAKGEVEAAVPVETEGGPGKVALNVTYLLDYLKNREGKVLMGVDQPSNPVAFRHGTSPLVVIMPMFVQW